MLVNSQLHRGNSCMQTHTLELIKLTQAYFTPDPEKNSPITEVLLEPKPTPHCRGARSATCL